MTDSWGSKAEEADETHRLHQRHFEFKMEDGGGGGGVILFACDERAQVEWR